MAITDFHSHYLPEGYIREVVRITDQGVDLGHRGRAARDFAMSLDAQASLPALLSLDEPRTEQLDRAGIETQVLSAGSFVAFVAERTVALRLVQSWNEHALNAITELNRYRIIIALPNEDPSDAITEVKNYFGDPKVIGFGIPTHFNGRSIINDHFLPLFEYLNGIGATLFLHPDGFCVGEIMSRHQHIDLGTQLENQLTVMRLYESGLLEQFPALKWVVPHLGGGIAFQLGRLDEHWERDQAKRELKKMPSAAVKQIFFDTAGHGMESLKFASKVLGDDRLVFGSDFPMVGEHDLPQVTSRVKDAGLEKDLHCNSRLLFNNQLHEGIR